jgi:hypothetical protein
MRSLRLTLFALFLVGCGGPTEEPDARPTCDGRPVCEGTIDAPSADAGPIPDARADAATDAASDAL